MFWLCVYCNSNIHYKEIVMEYVSELPFEACVPISVVLFYCIYQVWSKRFLLYMVL